MNPRNRAASFWPRRLVALALLYGLAVALAALAADGMMFHPSMASGQAPRESIRIPTGEGTSLGAVYLPNPGARLTVWYFYGNAESLGDIEPTLHEFHRRGYAVFAIDYPGYGLSDGRPTEQSLYAATRVAAAHLRDRLGVPLAQVVAVGRSIGGGPAVELAVTEPLAGLVAQSTFMSAYRVMTRVPLLPFDKFRNLAKFPRLRCPVLVTHGREDEVISFAHGRALFAAATVPKRQLWVAGAGHNNLTAIAGESYWLALAEFAATLNPPARP